MILADLLCAFLKVGFFAFGGAYGAIPLIRDVVLSYGWLSEERLSWRPASAANRPAFRERLSPLPPSCCRLSS